MDKLKCLELYDAISELRVRPVILMMRINKECKTCVQGMSITEAFSFHFDSDSLFTALANKHVLQFVNICIYK